MTNLLKKFTKPIAVGLLAASLALPNVGCINRDRSAYLGGHLLKRVITEGVGNVMGSKEQPQQQNYVLPEIVFADYWNDRNGDNALDDGELIREGNRSFENENQGIFMIFSKDYSGPLNAKIINSETSDVVFEQNGFLPEYGVLGRKNLTRSFPKGDYSLIVTFKDGSTLRDYFSILGPEKSPEGDCSTKKD